MFSSFEASKKDGNTGMFFQKKDAHIQRRSVMTRKRNCSKCGRLLCEEKDGDLEVKIKQHRYTFSNGVLRVICPFCGKIEVFTASKPTNPKKSFESAAA